MARVVRFHRLGGPEVLQIDQVDVPPPGKGEVQIAVKALGLMARTTKPTVSWCRSRCGQSPDPFGDGGERLLDVGRAWSVQDQRVDLARRICRRKSSYTSSTLGSSFWIETLIPSWLRWENNSSQRGLSRNRIWRGRWAYLRSSGDALRRPRGRPNR